MTADTVARCVLLVEDEMLLAMMLQDLLEGAGFRVVKAARLPAALELVGSELLDAAVLDVNIAGKEVFPVADELRERGVPFLFASGYGDKGVPDKYHYAPILQKPYGAGQMLEALTDLLDGKVAHT